MRVEDFLGQVPESGWRFVRGWHIRRGGEGLSPYECPVTATYRLPSHRWYDAAELMNMPPEEMLLITLSADRHPSSMAKPAELLMRSTLLAHLGLEEVSL